MLLLFMVASGASVKVQDSRQRICFSYKSDAVVSGDEVLAADCDSSDQKQSNWAVTTLSNSQGSQVVQFCIQGTSLCIGANKNRQNRVSRVTLVAQDSSDTAQQWTIDSLNLKTSYFNVLSNECLQVAGGTRRGTITTGSCTGNKRQQWIISSNFTKQFDRLIL